jgi:succinoglycan biosynthesis transport protein ExoP
VKVLAEIPARSSPDLRMGTLRRGELTAFAGLLEKLGGARAVLMTGEAVGRRQAAAGLAAAAASAGIRTALLECDLADPGLADALGLANAPGLHEFLRGAAEVGEIVKPVVLAGPGAAAATEPLVCVVAGRPLPDGWALLASDGFRRAIEGLRASYDLLVIDGPALADADALRSVLGLVDASLACVTAAEARRKLPVPVTGLVVQN